MTILQQCRGKSTRYRSRPTWQWFVSPETQKLGEKSLPVTKERHNEYSLKILKRQHLARKWTIATWRHFSFKITNIYIRTISEIKSSQVNLLKCGKFTKHTASDLNWTSFGETVLWLYNIDWTLSDVLNPKRTFSFHNLKTTLHERASFFLQSRVHRMVHSCSM